MEKINLNYQIGFEGYLEAMKVKISEEIEELERVLDKNNIKIDEFSKKIGFEKKTILECIFEKLLKEYNFDKNKNREYYEEKAKKIKNILNELKNQIEILKEYGELQSKIKIEELKRETCLKNAEKYLEKILKYLLKLSLSLFPEGIYFDKNKNLEYEIFEIIKINSFSEALREIIKLSKKYNSSLNNFLPEIKKEYSPEEIKNLENLIKKKLAVKKLEIMNLIEFKISLEKDTSLYKALENKHFDNTCIELQKNMEKKLIITL